MRYSELIEAESIYEIFVDMDGVVADFDKGFHDATGKWPKDISHAELKVLKKELVETTEFFLNLKPLGDASKLWNFVKKYDTKFLTATGDTMPEKAAKEKKKWIKKVIGNADVIVVRKLPMKAKFAHKNAILIDDREKALIPWKKAGGIAILHVSATDTIKQLKKLGL